MSMIEVKVAELSGKALDWAVAKAAGHVEGELHDDGYWSGPDYSTDWSQCGPLIEEYQIGLAPIGSDWHGEPLNFWVAPSHDTQGETPLIAACRAIVAAKLGDVVQVPAELLEARHD